MQASFGTGQAVVSAQISPLLTFNRFAFSVLNVKSDFAFIANASRAKQAFGFLRRRGAGFAFAVDGAESVVASRAGFGVAAGGTVRQNRRTGGAYAVVDEFGAQEKASHFAFAVPPPTQTKPLGQSAETLQTTHFPSPLAFKSPQPQFSPASHGTHIPAPFD